MAFSLDRVYILGDLSKLNKTPSDGTCLEEPRRGFCDVACSYCFYLNGGFSFIAFRRHSSFLGFSVTILPRLIRFWADVFYLQAFFILHSIVCDSDAGRTPHPGSPSVPALIELSLAADAWTWTTHIVVTRPLIYQLRQWATKHRVEIRLLNMFRLFKVISKDYKTNLNKTW